MFLIDGDLYKPDVWIQDEMEMGYCCAPGDRGYNLAVHLKRNRELSGFVTHELVDHDVALFENLAGQDNDGQDNGGNVESTPPVDVTSDPQPRGNAGPEMPAHPVAPFGKIVLGDCHNRHRRRGNGRVHDETRTFLHSQFVQPIIPINTSWLAVGHCDEIMSFIPSVTGRGSRLLMADCDRMEELLEEIQAIPFNQGRTHFHIGKFAGEYPHDYWEMIQQGTQNQNNNVDSSLWSTYAEVSAEDLATGDIALYSERIQTEFLDPIRERLMHCSNHPDDDVTLIPMYFKPGDRPTLPFGHRNNRTVSETVGMVNMQIVNNHLLIPKPFGPRMSTADAETVVHNVLGAGTTVILPPDQTEFTFWAWPGLPFEKVGLFFTHPDTAGERDEIIHRIKEEPDAIGPALELRTTQRREEIAKVNGLSPTMGTFSHWQRLRIPDTTVDVIETYMLTVLADTGCTSHFIDDWLYHIGMGEVHCGTNAKRSVPTGSNPQWWDVYDPTADTLYNPRA
jgi:hypothetical protein